MVKCKNGLDSAAYQTNSLRMEVSALQKVSNDVVKIVVKFDDTDGVPGQDPGGYLSVKKGSLDNKKFIVETEKGERLQVR